MERGTGRIAQSSGGRLLAALFLVGVLALAVSACGSSNADVTLTIGAKETPEEQVLGQIYAQALRSAGYKVKGAFDGNPEDRDGLLREVERGNVSGYPEHVDATLRYNLEVEEDDLPSDPQKAYEMARTRLEKMELTAFPPTPYNRGRPFVMLRKRAEAQGIAALSDLKGKSETMTLIGYSDCHLSSVDCLGGLEQRYGIYFKLIGYMYTPEEIAERYEQVEKGKFDAAVVYNTDGQLLVDKDKFIPLEDDRHLFVAGNTIFVTSQQAVDEAGSDYEDTIVAAQEGLTLPMMRRLNAEVEFEKKKPADVAAGYLRRIGLVD